MIIDLLKHSHYIKTGLFSAVIGSFLNSSTPSLQQDYTLVTASLLTELVIIQRTALSGGNISAIPHSNLTLSSPFSSSRRDIILNSLWISSLVVTLVVALACGIMKQWLLFYSRNTSGGSPKRTALTRQYHYEGLIYWRVPQIIESLPIIMNISVFLFFVGLILFCQDLSDMSQVTWFLVGLTTITFFLYIFSSFIPIWNPQCPYKTSLSKVYNGLFSLPCTAISLIRAIFRDSEIYMNLKNFYRRLLEIRHSGTSSDAANINWRSDLESLDLQSQDEGSTSYCSFSHIKRFLKQHVTMLMGQISRLSPPFLRRISSEAILRLRNLSDLFEKCQWFKNGRGTSMRTLERYAVMKHEAELQKDVLFDMVMKSTNPSVSNIALQSMSALHLRSSDESEAYLYKEPDALRKKLMGKFESSFKLDSSSKKYQLVDAPLAERYTRTVLFFWNRNMDTNFGVMHRIEAFCLSNDLQAIAIRACHFMKIGDLDVYRERDIYDVELSKKLANDIIMDISKCERIEITQVDKWSHTQFRALLAQMARADSFICDRKELLELLTDKLSPSPYFLDELSLQEEILIGTLSMLYGSYDVEVLIDHSLEELDAVRV